MRCSTLRCVQCPPSRAWIMAASAWMMLVVAPTQAQIVDYARAEALLDWNIERSIFNVVVDVHWLPDGDRFRYAVRMPDGVQYVEVDPAENTTSPVTGLGRSVDVPMNVVRSPEGQWDAFIVDNDIYMRPVAGDDSIRLTTDGTPLSPYGYGYGASNLNPRALREWGGIERVMPPVIVWAPDSRRFLVQRAHNEGVENMTLISSTTIRPTVYQWPYPLVGDSVIDMYSYVIVDVEARTTIPVRVPPIPNILGVVMPSALPPEQSRIGWSRDSDEVYFVTGDRGSRRLTLVAADARTGAVRDIVGDTTTTTTLEVYDWEVSADGRDVFWFSWRDGWGHFYRFDRKGRLKNPVTTGRWTVERIIRLDTSNRQLYFTARGREADRFVYDTYLYRVNFDGTATTLLTPEPGDHEVRISPSGQYIIDTYSQPHEPPITVLRRASDGRVIRALARADITPAVEAGFTPPRAVHMTGADGKTAIYGLMYTPSDFDPSKTYPVVDHFYGAPGGGVRWGFMRWSSRGFARALAELGVVVVEISGRGTGGRSKAFLDAFHGRMGLHTLPDHVAGIRDLARQYRFLDTTRVGIYGESRGGSAATAGMLRYPEFYKVAVAAAGDHDKRMYRPVWGEKFQGLYRRDPTTGKDNYEAEANYTLADRLEGKLLLIHGDMDDNVPPASTLRLAHALIQAGKKFDLMIVPDGDHGVLRTRYVIRLAMDYFVTHLLV